MISIPCDRESTQAEINRNNDQEAARTVTPATAGLEVPAAQPPDTEAS